MPDRVIEALALRPGQIVADVGAGTGNFSTRLAKAAAKPTVFAVDIEPKMVAYLTKRAATEGLSNVRAVQAAPENPNLPEPVDVVLVVDTFHHIGSRAAYFAGVRKSLRPGGRVAIIDFRKDAPGEGPPAHFRFTPATDLRRDGRGRVHARRPARLPPPATLPRLSQQMIGDRAISRRQPEWGQTPWQSGRWPG